MRASRVAGPRVSMQGSFAAARSLLKLFHHLVNAKSSSFLTRREFLERLEELADDLLRGHTDKGVVEPPVVVRVRRDVGPLVGIRSQIEEFRKAQGGEGLAPHPQRSRGALLRENKLPVVVAQADEVGVIVEVVELHPRTL